MIPMLACCACGTPAQRDAYNGFLNAIAKDCRPLIIGSDDIGQALLLNGAGGASPDSYHDFLTATSALYYGTLPPNVYRTSLTAQIGAGSNNARSFDCIVAHLPKN